MPDSRPSLQSISFMYCLYVPGRLQLGSKAPSIVNYQCVSITIDYNGKSSSSRDVGKTFTTEAINIIIDVSL